MPGLTEGKELPLVSVLIPLRNERRYIETCLRAVLAQDYPRDRLEVLVMDGRSRDGSRELVEEFTRQSPQVRLIDNPSGIIPVALNLGIAQAKGEIIVRVDGRSFIEPDYVGQCVDALRRTGAACVGGHARPMAEGYAGTTIALAFASPFGRGAGKFFQPSREGKADTVYLGAWRKDTLERAGLFHEGLERGQDIELAHRLRRRGERVYLSRAIRSRYVVRRSLLALATRMFQTALWNVRTLQVAPYALSLRHFIPFFFVTGLLGGAILSIFLRGFLYPYLGLLGLYLALNLAFSLAAARRGGWRHLPLLPLVFLIMHLSYGLGYYGGLARFGPPWKRIR